MAFVKYASVTSLGTADWSGSTLRKVASGPSNVNSYYIDGTRKLDIQGMLDKVADKYQISRDPDDFLFEAIRANSTNVPNENNDAFHKSELLRFDTRLAMPVYMTYIGKPHHLNHKADDPKRARGFILDAHYNEDAPALDNCPTCRTKTAEASARDASGIHCAKCGSVVKDEYVEILVGVDRKKDAALVEGIRAGILNAGSMGCNCASTVCNVCQHVAHNVNEFCAHIKGASKGTLWLKKGSKYERTDGESVKNFLRKAGYGGPKGHGNKVIDVSLAIPELDFEVRKAFENCQGVEFDEYSRVHKPADPKALSIEILRTAGVGDMSLEDETRDLVTRARQARLQETNMARAASSNKTYVAVRVNGSNKDIHIAASLDEALDRAEVGRRDSVEVARVKAASYAEAIRLARTAQFDDMGLGGDVGLGDTGAPAPAEVTELETDKPVLIKPKKPGSPGMPAPGAGKQPGEEQPGSMQDLQQQGPGDMGDVDDMGMPSTPPAGMPQPPGAGGPKASKSAKKSMPKGLKEYLQKKHKSSDEEDEEDEEDEKGEEHDASMESEAMGSSCKYAGVYGDFEIEVYDDHARLETASGRNVMLFRSAASLDTDEAKRAFGHGIIDTLLNEGLVRTAAAFNGIFSKRLADATEGAMTTMKGGFPNEAGGILHGAEHNMRGVTHKQMADSVTADADDDHQMSDRKSPDNVIGKDRWDNMQDEAEGKEPGGLSSHKDGDDDLEDSRGEYSVGDGAHEGAQTNMKLKASMEREVAKRVQQELAVAEERLKKVYASRIERMEKSHKSEVAELKREAGLKESTILDRFTKALKVAHNRQALNLEISPLKAELVDALTVPRPMGRSASSGRPLQYQGMDMDLALNLVESAWADSAKDSLDGLLTRAAELMQYDDKYLIDAERDLAKQAATIPTIASEEQLAAPVEAMERAASLREAAMEGNLSLAPEPADSGISEDRANRIRAALGSTHVGRILHEEIRPN